MARVTCPIVNIESLDVPNIEAKDRLSTILRVILVIAAEDIINSFKRFMRFIGIPARTASNTQSISKPEVKFRCIITIESIKYRSIILNIALFVSIRTKRLTNWADNDTIEAIMGRFDVPNNIKQLKINTKSQKVAIFTPVRVNIMRGNSLESIVCKNKTVVEREIVVKMVYIIIILVKFRRKILIIIRCRSLKTRVMTALRRPIAK